MIKKPEKIANDEFLSHKWDEVTAGRNFKEADIPFLQILCMWYQIADKAMDDMSTDDGIMVAYSNQVDDIKELPQISTLKKATDAIRQLNKQLQISDEPAQVVQMNRLTELQSKYKNGLKVVGGND